MKLEISAHRVVKKHLKSFIKISVDKQVQQAYLGTHTIKHMFTPNVHLFVHRSL